MSIFCYDLDETVVKGDIITQASRILISEGKIDKVYTNRNVIDWELNGLPDIVKAKTRELFKIPKYAVHSKIPIPGAEITLNYIYNKSHDIFALTSRPPECHDDTITHINKTFPDIFTDVICVDKSSKLHALASLDPDYYFDDNISFCEEARLLGIKNIYLISNEYTPWNHTLVHPDIKRIKNIAFFPINLI